MRLSKCIVGCGFACLLGFLLLQFQCAGGAQLVLSEVMPENLQSLADEDGDFPDWAEIQNIGDSAASLQGLFLSDDSLAPRKWALPSVELLPGEALVVFCSGKDRRSVADRGGNQQIDPSSVPGLTFWLDAMDSSTLIIEEGKVKFWLDKSGNENHASQGDTALMPQLGSYRPENFPVVEFDGDNDLLGFPEQGNIQTLFWVGFEAPEATNSSRPLLGHDRHFDFHRGRDSRLFAAKHTGAIQQGLTIVDGTIVDPTKVRMPDGMSQIVILSSLGLRANLLASDRFVTDRLWHGGVGEVLFFDRVLNASEIADVQAYLNSKWRLPASFLHSNFKLQPGTETLSLFDSAANLVDAVAIPEMKADHSLGRAQQGVNPSLEWRVFNQPTPGSLNQGDTFLGVVPTPEISIPAGSYGPGQRLSATVGMEGAVVRYTTNGSEPSNDSPVVTSPLVLEFSVSLRFAAFAPGYVPSRVVTQTYLIGSPSTFPRIALTTEPENLIGLDRGIYLTGPNASPHLPYFGANFWREWERPVSVELFGKDGVLRLQQTAGVKIHGGWSRAAPQKSLALIARNRYGNNRFEHRVFDEKAIPEFKQLLLRNSGNDWVRTLFRDAFTQRLAASLGLDHQAYQPVHTYLNGEYWGIYNLRERLNEHFVAGNHNLPLSDFDLLEGDDPRVINGDVDDFNRLLLFLQETDPRTDHFGEEIGRMIDLKNFFDYLVTQIFIDNTDWPENNVVYWREKGAEGLWRWIPFDLDGGFNIRHTGADTNTLAAVLGTGDPAPRAPWVPYITQRLFQNAALRDRFVHRFEDLLNTTYSTTNVLRAIESLERELDPEIERHIARWGGSESLGFVSFDSVEQWKEYVGIAKEFAAVRPEIVRTHLRDSFGLGAPVEFVLDLPNLDEGRILVNGLDVGANQASQFRGVFSSGRVVTIEAVSEPGYRFLAWSDGNGVEARRQVVLTEGMQLSATFEVNPAGHAAAAHPLADRPFGFQALSGSLNQESFAVGLTAREDAGILSDGLEQSPWTGPLDLNQGSGFEALGYKGVAFFNAEDSPGVSGFADAVTVSLDTRGVFSGSFSWTAEVRSVGEVDYGIRPQYRLARSGPYLEFNHVPASELVFRSPEEGTKPKRFSQIPLPLELLDQEYVELRWGYFGLDEAANRGRGPKIRLDDIVVLANEQKASDLDGEIVINEIHYHPASGDPRDEFIELYNRGLTAVDLSGWRLTEGIEFEIDSYQLQPGDYLVIAADLNQLMSAQPQISNGLGGWSGRLSNQSETIRLINARGDQVDRVSYADEGAWSVRVRGEADNGYRGWEWSNAHDGGGHSLALVAPSLSNNQGANWRASQSIGGSPGAANSVYLSDGPPLLSDVSHFPPVPNSSDSVTVRVQVRDENLAGASVQLFYRSQSDETFREAMLWDDGMHGDAGVGDRVFAVQLPPFPDQSIVSFFIRAVDSTGNESIWPRFEADSIDLAPLGLFQVDNKEYPLDEPLLRVVTSESEREELDAIGRLPWNASSDAQMNATFISRQGAEVEVRYLVGLRLRGSTSRGEPVKNRRINFASDERWKGRTAVILNAFNVPSQILGSRFFRMAGVPAAAARPVRFLENGQSLAREGAPQFGRYVELEALGDAFVERQFPLNLDGNLYRPSGNGNLEYLGPDADAYRQPGFYSKASNRERDDWSDLIELTRRLEQSSDDNYVEAIGELADLDRWISYFAVDTLLANFETSFANGGAGDYALFTNATDSKSYLIAYDLDSLWLGHSGARTAPLFRAAANPVPDRFLKHPALARRYHARLRELADTLFSPEILEEQLNTALKGWVSEEEVSRLKEAAAARRDFVVGESQAPLTIEVDRPFAEPQWLRYYLEDSGLLSLKGAADPVDVDSVWVNGQKAHFEVWSGRWEIVDVPLHFGVNQIVVEARSRDHEPERRIINVFRPGEGTRVTGGELAQDARWLAEASPIVVDRDLRVPEGVTLTIEPGTSIEFNRGAGLIVEGQLRAQGTPDQRILLSRNRRETNRWGGVQFLGGQETNELHHVTIEWSEAPTISIKDSVVSMEGLRWIGAYDSYLHTENSSLRLADSVLPDAVGGELITGFGVPEGGFWILDGNEFGTTASGGDIVDFSGGRRPNSILEIVDNVFVGGPDDGLDLDGAAALIDGNEFRNFRKANAGTGDAHAVSTGLYEGRPSDLTLVRNVFSDNEHALLMKEGAVAVAEHNTLVRSQLGTVNFSEVQRGTFPPDSLELRRSIIVDSPVFRHLGIAQGLNPDLVPVLENSLIFPPEAEFGNGNLFLDPLFEHPILDFRLQLESPAIAAGANGLDLGAFVGRRLRISGEPASLTPSRAATLFVQGVAMQAYRYRVNGGEWSEASSMDQPIVLNELNIGPYQVEVIGQNIAGTWQSETDIAKSRTWFVNPQLPGIRINEVLARNDSAHTVDGLFPDYVELLNVSDRPFDLSRMQLSDDRDRPNKFVFPSDTVLDPGEFVLVYADRQLEATGFHADFRVSGEGGGIYLRQRFSQGEALVDSVEFGRQLEDYSLSRVASGAWSLGEATPMMPNQISRLGQLSALSINEWLASPLREDADFVELFNSSSFPVHLGGAAISSEPTLGWKTSRFPLLSYIGAGEFVALYADNGDAGGPDRLDFTLADEQGFIGLLDASGKALNQVAYSYQRPGISMERVPPGGSELRVNGSPSPGRGATSQSGNLSIVLNEIVSDNRSDPGANATFPDWVELYNPSSEAIALEGYSLSDNLEEPGRWEFPASAVVEASSFLVIQFDAALQASESNTGFGLKADGDAVYLFQSQDSQRVLVDQIEFGLAAPGWSLSRDLQSGGWGLGILTPGMTNQSVSLGTVEGLRINEWMAQPERGSDWFEIFNSQDRPVEISGMYLTDDLAVVGQNPLPPLSFIGAGIFAYLVFEADGEPQRGAAHVDFRLSAGGESIGIYSSEGQLIDAVNFGEQARGISEGAVPDGGEEFVAFVNQSTRGKENFMDRDGDLIRDSWELLFGLNPESLEDGATDLDQDGVSNRLEFMAGTDPLDAASRFVIEGMTASDEGVSLSFQGQVGQAYVIETTDDLETGDWEEVWDVKRLAQTNVIRVNLGPASSRGYYRLLTR